MPGTNDVVVHVRTRLQRLIRRRRRPLAAGLAALATLLALTILRTPPSTVGAGTPLPTPSLIAAGEVAVPVLLNPAGISRTLHVGQALDIVGIGPDDSASVIAPDARIVAIDEAGGALVGSGGAIVMVAVPERVGLSLAAATAQGGLTALIRDIPYTH
jgi:hypothetical protein